VKRRLLIALAAVLVPLLLLLATAGWLLGSEAGVRTLVRLGERYAPGTLQVGEVSGHLLGALRIHQLDYRDGELHAALARFELDWSPRQLLHGLLRVDRLALQGLQLALPPSVPASEPATSEPGTPGLPDIHLPLALEVGELALDDISITPHAAAPIHVQQARLSANAGADGLQLATLDVDLPDYALTAALKGHVQPAGRWPLDLTLQARLSSTPLGAPLDATVQLKGDLDRLQAEASTRGAADSTLSAQLDDVLGGTRWQAQLSSRAALQTLLPELGDVPFSIALDARGDTGKAHIAQLQLRRGDTPLQLDAQGDVHFTEPSTELSARWRALTWPLNAEPLIASPQGRLSLSGSLQDYRATLDAELLEASAGKLQVALRASGDSEHARLDSLSARSADERIRLALAGEFTVATQAFSAQGDWQNLAWPLQAPATIESPRGKLSATGTPQDYRFSAELEARGPDIPAGRWQLAGQGTDSGVHLETLAGELLDGRIDGQADAQWAPQVQWQAKLSGERLDPGRFRAEWPGRIGFALDTEGRVIDGTPQLSLALRRLAGTLNGQKLDGGARAKLDGENLDLDELRLQWGQIQLQAGGKLAQRWDLGWSLKAPELAGTVPGVRGHVEAGGRLDGPRATPRLTLKTRATQLGWNGGHLDRLTIDADVDAAGRERSTLALDGADLELSGQRFSTLGLHGEGTAASHRAELSLQGEPLTLALALNGGIEAQDWRGRITRLELHNADFGDWRLASAVALRAGRDSAELARLCLLSAPARLCSEGQWSAAAGGAVKLKLNDFALARLKPVLPPDLLVESVASLDAEARLAANGNFAGGSVDARLAPGRLRYEASAAPVQLPLDARLEARSDGQQANLKAHVGFGSGDGLDAQLRLSALDAAAQLGGRIQARFTQLSILSALVPAIAAPQGRVDADLTLGGAVRAPALRGRAALTNAGVEVPGLGLKIEDLHFSANGDGKGGLLFDGGARSGGGQLNLSGGWQPSGQRLRLALRGNDFQAAGSNELQARISPDLEAHLADGKLQIGGELRVPQALVSPPKSSGGVSASADVHISGREEANATPLAIEARLRVILGNDVRVVTPGFKARLDGSLLVEQTPPLAPRATGSINVEEGEYRVYGQDLTIERGRLLFSGGPVNNPVLDLRVARTIDEVTAGARISGSAQRPQLKLFSEPSMPDASILSYLVFGRAPQSEESGALMRAAALLGAGQTSGIGDSIGKALGLDRLSLENSGGEGVSGTSVMLGKYLTPDLYVSYGVGLFEPAATFLLRYKLTKTLSVETRSTGSATGGDLIYSIER